MPKRFSSRRFIVPNYIPSYLLFKFCQKLVKIVLYYSRLVFLAASNIRAQLQIAVISQNALRFFANMVKTLPS